MRVLTFVHSFETGGVERVALRLSHAWVRQGVDARLFVGREEGALQSDIATDVPTYVPRPLRWSSARIETLWMILTLPRHVRDIRPDILFCAGNSYSIVAVALRLILGASCPPIVMKVSNDLHRADMPRVGQWFYHRWLRLQRRAFARFVAMAPPEAIAIAERFGVSDDCIATIHDPAVTLEEIDRHASLLPTDEKGLRSNGGKRRLVTIARLTPQKNLALLIAAFARGARPADSLTIFGEGPQRAKLERLIDRLDLRSRVILAGHVSDPIGRLAEYDLFVSSSDYEGVPAVLIEAMAAGLPIIATRSSVSIDWMLSSGRHGIVVSCNDVAALGAALHGPIPPGWSGENARHRARRFTIETSAPAYRDLFNATKRLRPIAPDARDQLIHHTEEAVRT